MVPVRQHLTDILEKRPRLRHRRRTFRRPGPRFVNLVNPVGLHVPHHALLPAAPRHFKRHALAPARREDAQRVRPGKIKAPAGRFLALHGKGAAQQLDFPADALGVGRPALQAHGHARGGAAVVIHAGDTAQVVHHNVQAAVIVQISQGDPIVQRRLIQSPLRPDLFEFQIAQIAKGDHRSIAWRRLSC